MNVSWLLCPVLQDIELLQKAYEISDGIIACALAALANAIVEG